MSFLAGSLVAFVLLAGLSVLVGRRINGHNLGILIDARGRISLNQLQVVMWTLLVVSVWAGIFFATWTLVTVPQNLVVLMGISVGSAAIAGAVKSNKDMDPTVMVAKAGEHPMRDGSTKTMAPGFAQVFKEEEGDQADATVNITKFQNFIFIAVLGVAFVVLALRTDGFPELPTEALYLLGISSGGYVAGKMPDKN